MIPYPVYNLDELVPVAPPSDAPEGTQETYRRKWGDAFGAAIESGYSFAVIVPNSDVAGSPYESDINYREDLNCAGQHEEQLVSDVVQDGETLGAAGDWLLLFNFPM